LATAEVLVPFTVTVAPASGSPDGERSVPRTSCCADTARHSNIAITVLTANIVSLRFIVYGFEFKAERGDRKYLHTEEIVFRLAKQ
jgi:hypothetical protein